MRKKKKHLKFLTKNNKTKYNSTCSYTHTPTPLGYIETVFQTQIRQTYTYMIQHTFKSYKKNEIH
jgi:hypothetical protein